MVLPHVDSILFMCDQTLEEFLGNECFKFYTETLQDQKVNRDQRHLETAIKLGQYGSRDSDIKRTVSLDMRLHK